MQKEIAFELVNKRFKFASSDDDPYLFCIRDNHEPDFLEFVKVISSLGIYKEDTVDCIVDIGANIGLKSIPVTCLAKRVVAVEANKKVFQFLKQNVSLNGVENMSCRSAAITDFNGFVNFKEAWAWGHIAETGEQIEGLTLNSLFIQEEILLADILKIDCEGNEASILQAKDFLKSKVKFIWLEFNSWCLIAFGGQNPRSFLEYLVREYFFVAVVRRSGTGSLELQRLTLDTFLAVLHDNLVYHGCVDDLVCIANEADFLLLQDAMEIKEFKPDVAPVVGKALSASVRESVNVSGFDEVIARRVRMTVNCTDADLIPKVENAGAIVLRDDVRLQVMHNGLVVEEGCYYGPWMTEIIRCLRGHHEPQEELSFDSILRRIRDYPTNDAPPTMVEFGSFWAYYSLWFLQEFPNAQTICLEPDPNYLEVGKRNFEFNGRKGVFIQVAVGNSDTGEIEFKAESTGETIKVRETNLAILMRDQNLSKVDIVFADIQGAELALLENLPSALLVGDLRFVVVSTHDLEISGSATTHQKAVALLESAGAHIIVEHSVSESFSGDGLIVASFSPLDRDFAIDISYARSKESLFGEWEPRLEFVLGQLRQTSRLYESQLAISENFIAIKNELGRMRDSEVWRMTLPLRWILDQLKILQKKLLKK